MPTNYTSFGMLALFVLEQALLVLIHADNFPWVTLKPRNLRNVFFMNILSSFYIIS